MRLGKTNVDKSFLHRGNLGCHIRVLRKESFLARAVKSDFQWLAPNSRDQGCVSECLFRVWHWIIHEKKEYQSLMGTSSILFSLFRCWRFQSVPKEMEMTKLRQVNGVLGTLVSTLVLE